MNIGELAKQSGLAASHIRFYEAQGLISQVGRQANGYRRYAPEALQMLQLIQSAQQAGFTLQELKAMMPVAGEHKREELIEGLERKVQQIEAMQVQLAHSKAQLLGVIETVRAQPEGVPCSMGQERVLASLESPVGASLLAKNSRATR
ncbi:MerR family transcriptional regulator [Pseudomonas brenneri]|jgi:DNA-binding transcriptional MerR regulator|uniref:MerR family transcriptional regulator n=1 Tax=Pseudomonas brenneri TaxID=129817 RepID=UPI0025A2FA0B|nr:MerR family transcriptional regulator [Pseudomonas brenneri]WJM89000.1 MerR family transcriptional regulator [Pseudomonas brenneri]